jgi:hypothetical protein
MVILLVGLQISSLETGSVLAVLANLVSAGVYNSLKTPKIDFWQPGAKMIFGFVFDNPVSEVNGKSWGYILVSGPTELFPNPHD